MDMKSYRFALIPQRHRQGLYREYKKPIEHFLRVLLKKVGARIQRLEENDTYVYIRLTMPEGTDAQRAIARVKRESAAALYARLKRNGFDVACRGNPVFWLPDHYMDTRADEKSRGDMTTFVGDALLSNRQREQIAEYARKRGAEPNGQ